MRKLSLALLLIIAVLFWACDNRTVYEQNYDLSNKVWEQDDIPTFRFHIAEPGMKYNIYYNVRNTISYPYQNLYVTYFLEDTLGRLLSSELHNMDLFHPKTGKPKGRGIGDVQDHQFLALPDYEFDSAGMYQLRIQQFMRMETLPEVLSIGIKVEKTRK
jgi:gliding motility-associated lipoprotein GldH